MSGRGRPGAPGAEGRRTNGRHTAMGDGGSETDAPSEAACALRLQPPTAKPNSSLEAPVALDDVVGNMSPPFAQDSRRCERNVQRRSADRALLGALAAQGFTGRHYERFEEDLSVYGISVLRGWMHSGYLFKLLGHRGFALHPTDRELEELSTEADARDELANMTVALALPRFRERALIGGGWRWEGGASLSTYFVGACLYVFPNEFRKRRVYHAKWAQALRGEARLAPADTDGGSDPAELLNGEDRVMARLRRAEPRTRAVLALTLDGYTQDEIAELLDEKSVRAIEGLIYRWRAKELRRPSQGDADDGT